MNSPGVTLLIPCYNAARYLPRLLNQVRSMSGRFDAILAYDDGSTDDTREVARVLHLPMLASSPNRGVAHARNQLAAAATTEWIHFHDADDRIHADFLTRLLPLAGPDTDVVSCDADWINEADGVRQIAWRYNPASLDSDPAPHLLANPLGLNNSLIRRLAWNQVGGCDESLAIWEDADLHFRLALAGARWRHQPEVLTWSLRNPTSFSNDYLRNWRCRLQALEKYAALPAAHRLELPLAREAETTAINLLALGDVPAARNAVRLAQRLGAIVPTTHNPLLRLIRAVFPPLFTLQLQRLFRSLAPSQN